MLLIGCPSIRIDPYKSPAPFVPRPRRPTGIVRSRSARCASAPGWTSSSATPPSLGPRGLARAPAICPCRVLSPGLAPLVVVALHPPATTPVPAEVHAVNELHTGDLRATPLHRALHRVELGVDKPPFVQAANRCYAESVCCNSMF
jgi:hypothetical protein